MSRFLLAFAIFAFGLSGVITNGINVALNFIEFKEDHSMIIKLIISTFPLFFMSFILGIGIYAIIKVSEKKSEKTQNEYG